MLIRCKAQSVEQSFTPATPQTGHPYAGRCRRDYERVDDFSRYGRIGRKIGRRESLKIVPSEEPVHEPVRQA